MTMKNENSQETSASGNKKIVLSEGYVPKKNSVLKKPPKVKTEKK